MEFPAVFKDSLGQYTVPCFLSAQPKYPASQSKTAVSPICFPIKDRQAAGQIHQPGHNRTSSTCTLGDTPTKPDGSVCICANCKCTIKKTLVQHAHPVPVIKHPGITGGQPGLAQTYQQLLVDGAIAEAQTIVPHHRTIKVNRLQFGVVLLSVFPKN